MGAKPGPRDRRRRDLPPLRQGDPPRRRGRPMTLRALNVPSADDLAANLDSWEIHLRAERKTDHTVRSYLKSATLYLDWCAEEDRDPLDVRALEKWTTELLAGRTAGTVKIRVNGVRHFTRWLAA